METIVQHCLFCYFMEHRVILKTFRWQIKNDNYKNQWIFEYTLLLCGASGKKKIVAIFEQPTFPFLMLHISFSWHKKIVPPEK